jgi:hypothetical protein
MRVGVRERIHPLIRCPKLCPKTLTWLQSVGRKIKRPLENDGQRLRYRSRHKDRDLRISRPARIEPADCPPCYRRASIADSADHDIAVFVIVALQNTSTVISATISRPAPSMVMKAPRSFVTPATTFSVTPARARELNRERRRGLD